MSRPVSRDLPTGLCRAEAHRSYSRHVAFAGRDAAVVIFAGTTADYIKLSPVLRELQERSISYALIDSGQHSDCTPRLRSELGLRPPDTLMSHMNQSAPLRRKAIEALRLLGRSMLSPKAVVGPVSARRRCIALVHGNTVTTLLGALISRRLKWTLVHLEAGTGSGSCLRPFPEQLITSVVSHCADVLLVSTELEASNLKKISVRNCVHVIGGNTVSDALSHVLRNAQDRPRGDPLPSQRSQARDHTKPCEDGLSAVTVERDIAGKESRYC